MRAAVLALALCAACASTDEFAAEAGFAAFPEFGVAVTGRQRIAERGDRDVFVEGRAVLQDADDAGGQDGRFLQFQGGARVNFARAGNVRPFARAGATWFRATGDVEEIGAGDYLGAYAGGGLDVEFAPRWTLSPELSFHYGQGEGSLGGEGFVQFVLAVSWRF